MVERSFAVLGMIVGGFVFSTLIGNITAMAHKTDISKQEQRKKMDLVGAFVRDHTLPKHLKSDVLLFFNRQEVRGYEEKAFLAEMPFSIRRDVLLFTYSHLMEHASFFHAFGDEVQREHFMVEFLCAISPISFCIGASVFSRGDRGFKMFLLADGALQILSHDRSKVVKELEPGAIFGCSAVLGDPVRRFNIKACINSKAVSLEIGAAVKLMANFPEMRTLLQAEIDDEARVGVEIETEVVGGEVERQEEEEIAESAAVGSDGSDGSNGSNGGSVNEFITGLMPTPAPSSPSAGTAHRLRSPEFDALRAQTRSTHKCIQAVRGGVGGDVRGRQDVLDRDQQLASSFSRLESKVEKVNDKLHASLDGIKKQLFVLKTQLARGRSSPGTTTIPIETADI
jgi:hypothetical protein